MRNAIGKYVFSRKGVNPDAWDTSKLTLNYTLSGSQGNAVTAKPDGTEVYTYLYSQTLRQWTLSTPWDLSTATLTHENLATGFITQGIRFKPDGLKMYSFGNAQMKEWDLSTPWDLSTLSSLSTNSVPSYMTGCFMKPDGLKAYSTNQSSELVYEYNLSVAWDISTGVLGDTVNVATNSLNAQEVFWKSDGLIMYVGNTSSVKAYDIFPAWDLTSASYNSSKSLNITASGLFWRDDGEYLLANVQTSGVKEYIMV